MNILIVDDGIVSRTKMETILKTVGVCTVEEHARNALETFEAALASGRPFDLVTLDIQMPDMDGIELLHTLRQLEQDQLRPDQPRARIFMVTSQADKDSLITCLQAGCDGFIVKPFNRETLFEKLRLKGLPVDEPKAPAVSRDPGTPGAGESRRSLIDSVALALKEDLVRFPTLPDIDSRLKILVRQSADREEVIGLLKQDMLIAGSLIRLSNSSLYRGLETNRTLEEAVTRLGMEETVRHVETLCYKSLYTEVGENSRSYIEGLWAHARTCAWTCQFLAEECRLQLEEDPFTLGLVHDIGRLVLFQIINKLKDVGMISNETSQEVMYTALDAYHGEFGAVLLKRWEFSDVYAEVARFHDSPETALRPSRELVLVGFANRLSHHFKKPVDEFVADPRAIFCADQLALTDQTIRELFLRARMFVTDRMG